MHLVGTQLAKSLSWTFDVHTRCPPIGGSLTPRVVGFAICIFKCRYVHETTFNTRMSFMWDLFKWRDSIYTDHLQGDWNMIWSTLEEVGTRGDYRRCEVHGGMRPCWACESISMRKPPSYRMPVESSPRSKVCLIFVAWINRELVGCRDDADTRYKQLRTRYIGSWSMRAFITWCLTSLEKIGILTIFQ